MVDRVAAATGPRSLDRGCGTDPGQLCSHAEDGPAGCRSHFEAFNGGSFSTYMDSECGAARSALRDLPLDRWAACRREDLLGLLASLDTQIEKLDVAVERLAKENPQARLLMMQPGVGPITSLAFVLTIGDVSRFKRGKQVASYLGLIPRERSSGGKQRLGAINKQGNSFMRTLLVESAQTVTRLDEGFRKQYLHRCHRMAKGVAMVAAARRLAVRLFWMLRSQTGYPEIVRIESSPALAVVSESETEKLIGRSRIQTGPCRRRR